MGLTFIEVPLPIELPVPQPPVYHFQDAPVPKDPPFMDKVEEPPEQIFSGDAEAEVGAVEAVLTVTVTEAQVVFPQSPSALT